MPRHPSLSPLLFTAWLATEAIAQCTPTWNGDDLPFVSGSVLASTVWDPDGVGPLPLRLVVGGSLAVGSGTAPVATWDGTQWQALPAFGGVVRALCVWNGQVVAATNTSVHQWNGTAWQTLAIVLPLTPTSFQSVDALCVHAGRLYVGGNFGSVANVPATSLASFDGTTWSQVGNGISGTVLTMASFNGQLFVGGLLAPIGGPGTNLAAWNGTAWVPTATFNGVVQALTVQSSFFNAGQLFVGGTFTQCNAFGAQHIARYSDTTGTWSAVAGGLPGAACTALVANNGILNGTDVIAAVDNPGTTTKAWRWNGTAWSAMPPVPDTLADPVPSCAVVWNGQPALGLRSAHRAVRVLTGGAFAAPMQAGVQDPVLAVDGQGVDVVIAGGFAQLGGVTMNGVARGGPGNWQPLGSGVGVGGTVLALARTANGELLVGGTFSSAGGSPANNVARWNGSAWSALGTGVNGTVHALRVLGNGDIVAAGAFTTAGGSAANRIARWNGTAWSPLGTGLGATCNALAVAGNGDLLAGGAFTTAGGLACNRIARWNGSAWSPLGSGVDATVNTIAIRPNGEIAIGGAFLNAGAVSAPYVALWNGSTWTSAWQLGPHPLGPVSTLLALPDGDLLGGGPQWSAPASFPFAAWTSCLMRWNAGQWTPLGVLGTNVRATALADDGSMLVVGDFVSTAGIPHANVARRSSGCPALAAPYGTGCSGAGGANTLVATELPGRGGTFRGLATGMPPLGFAVVVTGLGALSLPVAAVLPQGLPGCSVLVTPDVFDLVIPVGGQVTTQLAIPDTISLIGAQLRQQVAAFETGAGGAVTAITSTNALLLTIGDL